VAEHTAQGGIDGACAHCELPRVADLTEHLALADDHRIEAGDHDEQVRDSRFVVVRVQAGGEVVGIAPAALDEEVDDVLDAGVEPGAARVDLRAVARRYEHDLREVRTHDQPAQDLGPLAGGDGYAFEEPQRRAPVVQAHHHDRHDR
jgi:hypothetical protein